jgi:hypothetical protein
LYANERSFCRDYVSYNPKHKIFTILGYCKPPKVEHEYVPYQCVLEGVVRRHFHSNVEPSLKGVKHLEIDC